MLALQILCSNFNTAFDHTPTPKLQKEKQQDLPSMCLYGFKQAPRLILLD